MDTADPQRIVLEFDRLEPLSGRVGHDGEPLQPFSGWMGLAAALERLLRDAADGAGAPP